MKIISGLFAALGLYLLASYFTGVSVEKKVQQFVTDNSAALAKQGYQLELTHYERKFFTSHANVTVHNSNLDIAATFDSRITHGPILFHGGLAIGLMSSVNTFSLKSNDADIDAEINEFLGDVNDYFSLTTQVYYTNSFKQLVKVLPFKKQNDNESLAFDGMEFSLTGNIDTMKGAFKSRVGKLQVGSEVYTVDVAPITLDGVYEKVSDAVFLSNYKLNISSINVAATDEEESAEGADAMLSIQDFSIDSTQTLNGGLVDNKALFRLKSVAGMVDAKDVELGVELNKIPLTAMDYFVSLSNAFYANSADEMTEEELQKVTAALRELVNKSQLLVKLDGKFMGDGASINSLTELRNAPESLDAFVQNTKDFLYADLTITLSERLLTETFVGIMMSEHFEEQGDQYVLHARLEDGKILINGNPLPEQIYGGSGDDEDDMEDDMFDELDAEAEALVDDEDL